MAAVLGRSIRLPHHAVHRLHDVNKQGVTFHKIALQSILSTQQRLHGRMRLDRRCFVTATLPNRNSIVNYLGDAFRARSLRPANPILTSFQDLWKQLKDTNSLCPTILPDFTKFRPHHLPQAWDQAMKTAVQQILKHSETPDSTTLLDILQPLYYIQSLRRLYLFVGNETEEWLLVCCKIPSNVEDAVVEQLNKTSGSSSSSSSRNGPSKHWFVSLFAPAHHVVRIQTTTTSSTTINDDTTLALYDSLATLRNQFRETHVHDTARAIMEAAAVGSASSFSTSSKRQSKLEQVEDMYMFLELHQKLANTVLGHGGGTKIPSNQRQHLQQQRQTYADVMLQHRVIPQRKQLEQLHEQVAEHFLPTVYEEMERQAQRIVQEAMSAKFPPTRSTTITTTSNSETSLQYFTLDGVLGALMAWSRAVLGIAFYEEVDRSKINGWHPSVRLFYVYDETVSDETLNASSSRPGRRLGSLYLDPFKRNYKTRQFWACLVPTTPLIKTPILCLNVPPCWDADPAFVQLRDVQNIFHEFGHALHVLSSEQDLNHAPQAVDTREFWSCFMEYWLLQDSVRQALAHFSQWPEPIPPEELKRQHDELVMDKIQTTMHHVYEGLLELRLFSQFDPQQGDSLVEYQRRLAEHYRPTDVPAKGDLSTLMGLIHDHCSFEFVMARYHYLISDILAAQAFATFERRGLQDSEAVRQCGLEFRRLFSTPGDTAQDTMTAVAKFSGQNPPILDHLKKYYKATNLTEVKVSQT